MKKNLIAYSGIIIFTILSGIFISSCSDEIVAPPTSTGSQTGTYNSDVATKWLNLELDLIKQTPSLGFTPPVSSRALGYTGITLYESVVNGMPLYKSLSGQLNGLSDLPQITTGSEYHWPSSANASLYYIIKKLYSNATPANFATMDSLYAAFKTAYQSQVSADVFNRSDDFGTQIGTAIHNWSTSDGGNDAQLHNVDPSYVPPVGPGFWVPTPPAFSPPLQPHWGDNRPFLTINVTTNQPPAPIRYSESDTSLFYAQALEVFSMYYKLTSEQSIIAKFWSDGGGTYTPPGHWIAVTGLVLNTLGSKLDISAVAYAKVGIAVSDAFISCWKSKYTHNLLRPISYIRAFISPTWNPLIATPPFPEYTSGHSSQSGAAAQVLSDIFGHNFSYTDNTHPELSFAPRSFTSFFAAANEAAISRLYGGIHYRAGNDRGLECGIFIGRNVSALQFLR